MGESKAEIFRDLLRRVQEGEDEEEIKKEFKEKLGDLSQEELAEAEKELIASGVQPEEVQSMCDIHASVYLSSHSSCSSCQACQESGEKITATSVMAKENEGVRQAANYLERLAQSDLGEAASKETMRTLAYLKPLSLHYAKKEDLFFPYLYRHQVTSVPQVMWGVDDEIRKSLKSLSLLKEEELKDHKAELKMLAQSILSMAEKEDSILSPLFEKTLSAEEKEAVLEEMPNLGFPFLKLTPALKRVGLKEEKAEEGFVNLKTGKLAVAELISLLNALPMELTFINKDGLFTYFNKSSKPIFIRTKAQLNENVENCHPVKALPAVRQVLSLLSSGQKDSVTFLMEKEGEPIWNNYIAVKSESGVYLGCLEVSQNISGLMEEAEKRKLNNKKQL